MLFAGLFGGKEIQKVEGKLSARIVRKFVWLKTLEDYTRKKRTVFMRRKNIVQIQHPHSLKWTDISWAAAQ